jgi:acetylornithine deacetylase/succinyl-diaminopimelate desuccinylase-like protein
MALAYSRASFSRSVAALAALVRIPTVSADPARRRHLVGGARWLARHLNRVGLEGVQVFSTAGHPIVYAEWRHAPGRPTVLVYGHYDVQPEDPRGRWRSAPFEPEIREGVLYGRGASDDKGQLLAHVAALEAWLRGANGLPLNIKCIFEGEEEIGSPHLASFITANRGALAADVAVISDTSIPGLRRPALTYALRGAFAAEMVVRGPRADLHSGLFGGAAPNPLEALCRILATLHDGRGVVTLRGFYDDVSDVAEAERARLRRGGPRDEAFARSAGIVAIRGEPGFSAYELTTIRPALEINGVTGGYQGGGPKSVIPAVASAKLSARLVPDQDPQRVERLLREHVARLTPPGFSAELVPVFHALPIVVDPRHPAMRAAACGYREAFGLEPVHVRSGGTVPAASILRELLGIPPVLMGFALPEDHVHGPNEGFSLDAYRRAIHALIVFFGEIGSASATRCGPPRVGVRERPSVVELAAMGGAP